MSKISTEDHDRLEGFLNDEDGWSDGMTLGDMGDFFKRVLRERTAEIERLAELCDERHDAIAERVRERDEALALLQECVDFERLCVDDFEAKYGRLGIETRNIDGSTETETIDRAITFLAQVDGETLPEWQPHIEPGQQGPVDIYEEDEMPKGAGDVNRRQEAKALSSDAESSAPAPDLVPSTGGRPLTASTMALTFGKRWNKSPWRKPSELTDGEVMDPQRWNHELREECAQLRQRGEELERVILEQSKRIKELEAERDAPKSEALIDAHAELDSVRQWLKLERKGKDKLVQGLNRLRTALEEAGQHLAENRHGKALETIDAALQGADDGREEADNQTDGPLPQPSNITNQRKQQGRSDSRRLEDSDTDANADYLVGDQSADSTGDAGPAPLTLERVINDYDPVVQGDRIVLKHNTNAERIEAWAKSVEARLRSL